MHWLKQQETHQLYSKTVKRTSTRHIYASRNNKIVQIDLIDMSKSTYNNFNYILTVIDIFSKIGFAYPIKKKTTEDVKHLSLS